MTQDVEISRRRLVRYFLRDCCIRIGDTFLQVRPLVSDIPRFSSQYYDSRDDSFVIQFQCDKEPVAKRLSPDVCLLVEPGTEKIAGITVSAVRKRGIDSVTANLCTVLNNYQSKLLDWVGEAREWNEELRRAGRVEVEKRKLSFFSNEIPKAILQASPPLARRVAV